MGYEVMVDLKSNETKIDVAVFQDLSEKQQAVDEMIGRLRSKVGNVERSGRVQLSGGVPTPHYEVPDAEGLPALGEQTHEVPEQGFLTANQQPNRNILMEMLEEEMQKDINTTAEAAMPPAAFAQLIEEEMPKDTTPMVMPPTLDAASQRLRAPPRPKGKNVPKDEDEE